ncbi:alpha-(1,6)-fucosyltransferase [Ixodes scapularis]
MAYEIMQLSHVDASKRFQSLDDIYYFGGQKDHSQVAAYDHTARGASEMDIRKGDILGIAGNHWDGYSKGVNRRTGKQGLYPSFKAVEKVDVVDFPPYEDDDNGHRNEVK